MNLIIKAEISEPPTELLYFRYFSGVAREGLGLDCLVESPCGMKDMYYHYLSRQGCFDYVCEIITPEEREDGIRIDTRMDYPMTIITRSITGQNCLGLLGRVRELWAICAKIRYGV